MSYQEECIYHYRKLLALLEEERRDLPNCLEGNLADTYFTILQREETILQQEFRKVQQILSI